MNKLLIISGPTATGKTSLAIDLAKNFNGELISADSRQIYRGMDIGTGKDHPKNTVIHLIDIVNPNESYSVAQYCRLALEKIKEIQRQDKLPIIVGGTGQYIDSILNPKETFSVKPNNFIRFFLNRCPVKCLQAIYKFLNKPGFENLNNSDRNNPHRLIRKIEISLYFGKISCPPLPARPAGGSKGGLRGDLNVFHLSLTAPNSVLFPKINKRIQQRLDNGLLKEIETLLKKYKWTDPGLNTLAYKEFSKLNKNDSLEECIKKWQSDEHNYVRRQKTWFKKRQNITFLDISQNNRGQIIDMVAKWYNKS